MAAAVLTKKDVKQVLTYINKHNHPIRNKAVFLLTLYAGLRAKEVSLLRLSDVFEQDFSIKTSIQLTTAQTKYSKSRAVPINKKLAVALIDLLAVTKDKRIQAPLIQSQQSGSFTANTISQLLFHIYKKANLSNCSAHSGRRTFITALSNNAISVRVIQKLAGHSSLATTQLYIDVTDSQLESAVHTL